MCREKDGEGSEGAHNKPLHQRSRRAKGGMYFTVRQGSTETKANAVRPLDITIRAYYLATTVTCVSLGGPPWIPLIMPFLFSAKERVATSGQFVFGVVFLAVGSLSFAMYLLDCVSRCALSGMSTSQLRKRLAKSEKSAKYVAKDRHLRGEKIGAWFFGTATAALFLALLTRWLVWGVPVK